MKEGIYISLLLLYLFLLQLSYLLIIILYLLSTAAVDIYPFNYFTNVLLYCTVFIYLYIILYYSYFLNIRLTDWLRVRRSILCFVLFTLLYFTLLDFTLLYFTFCLNAAEYL